jgi:hypothetical protein
MTWIDFVREESKSTMSGRSKFSATFVGPHKFTGKANFFNLANMYAYDNRYSADNVGIFFFGGKD